MSTCHRFKNEIRNPLQVQQERREALPLLAAPLSLADHLYSLAPCGPSYRRGIDTVCTGIRQKLAGIAIRARELLGIRFATRFDITLTRPLARGFLK